MMTNQIFKWENLKTFLYSQNRVHFSEVDRNAKVKDLPATTR